MRIVRLKATGVHEYLNFNVKFNPDVNFIAGLNGSGKTTALNLISALLTPTLEELSKIDFEYVELEVKRYDGSVVRFESTQNKSGVLTIKVIDESSKTYNLSFNRNIFMGSVPSFLKEKYSNSELVRFVCDLPSPMYLSLGRRFVSGQGYNKLSTPRIDVILPDKNLKETRLMDKSMAEALGLVFVQNASIKERHVQEDRKFRDKIILDSFHINIENEISIPNEESVRQFIDKQRLVKKALSEIDLQGENFERIYDEFFKNINEIQIGALEFFNKHRNNSESNRRSNKKVDSTIEGAEMISRWFSNNHQMQRIDRLINIIKEHEESKSKVYEPLMKFEVLVNTFLEQTGKKVEVTSSGALNIYISDIKRPITVLSSGERQILIMLAHLSLNPSLPKNGMFIVDEPELSLHIAWQEMFVEAVQSANPNLQLILATHSPAIIGGREKYYTPLNGKV